MEILGIGPLELLLILMIALIVLGPDEMVKACASVGKFIRRVRHSETWQGFQRMSRSLKTLPEDLARQSGIEEMRNEITGNVNLDDRETSPNNNDTEQKLKAWTQAPRDASDKIDLGDAKIKDLQSSPQEDDQDS